ncbi:hypothetical protein CDAR_284051 [Caerostris darwini]|uniref:Uncharacterized protein n=1 Tax=Caerostris darwini TaxID=1538125 RepID=A0AAV4PII3_9ARAC|nr:hypothetical protein CDAR_284051 [Caerostris darwini]
MSVYFVPKSVLDIAIEIRSKRSDAVTRSGNPIYTFEAEAISLEACLLLCSMQEIAREKGWRNRMKAPPLSKILRNLLTTLAAFIIELSD